MNSDDPRLARIKANAELVCKEFASLSGADFGYDKSSVEWTDAFIERQRTRGQDHDGLGMVLASYLGEAIVHNTQGAWAEDDSGNIGIRFQNGDWCYPFAKTKKQFAEGRDNGESVASFYDTVIGVIATGKLSHAVQSNES